MAYIAYIRRHKQGENFEPSRDSVLGIKPVLNEPMPFPTNVRCGVCDQDATFLLQLGTSYKETVERVLLVYFCKDHAEESDGWCLYRYSAAVEPKHETKMSAFEEMNSLTSWASGIDFLSPSAATANQLEFDEGSRRIIMEDDFITPMDMHKEKEQANAMFNAYKCRSKEEIDEEDHVDLEYVVRAAGNASSDEDESIAESDEVTMDENLLRFQLYVSARPTAIIRYHWAGEPVTLEGPPNINKNCVNCGGSLVFEFQLLPDLMRHM
ncbi:hypothetical protein BgAZ_207190 [Babesia gibsoni]|uniref:Programmed cell death protein 2 C-terminal domain-containing protein n=1 Tax=Babesia gibsoni TaxID=33632 RepID=A0AAD8PEF6_BABGI|nr:hypothetical protein BgAZ_207190 [Babesia gibsoni]